LKLAAGQSVRRSANSEAIGYLQTGLELLNTLPNTAERLAEEVTLQLALTVPMAITEGPGSLRAERAYKRARELCEQFADNARLAPALWGMFLMYLFRAEYRTAGEVAEQLRRVGEHTKDSRILLWGHYAVGSNSCWLGEFSSALHHLREALALYDP